jgi:hypothetical protein
MDDESVQPAMVWLRASVFHVCSPVIWTEGAYQFRYREESARESAGEGVGEVSKEKARKRIRSLPFAKNSMIAWSHASAQMKCMNVARRQAVRTTAFD